MNNTKHTPGPWMAGQIGEKDIPIFAQGKDIGNVYGGEVDYSEFCSNARLIAAAPEMLEALEAMLDAFGVMRKAGVNVLGFETAVEARIKAHAAIAKATGGAE